MKQPFDKGLREADRCDDDARIALIFRRLVTRVAGNCVGRVVTGFAGVLAVQVATYPRSSMCKARPFHTAAFKFTFWKRYIESPESTKVLRATMGVQGQSPVLARIHTPQCHAFARKRLVTGGPPSVKKSTSISDRQEAKRGLFDDMQTQLLGQRSAGARDSFVGQPAPSNKHRSPAAE